MKIIDELVEAYNRGDARAFADTFAENAIAYEHPNQIAQETRDGIYRHYTEVFEKFPFLKTKVLYRAIIGNRVIDHELVTRSLESEPFEVMAIYEVENNQITRLDLVRESKTIVKKSETMQNIKIREIEPEDNQKLAKIVRDTLAEFGSDKPGTVYFDKETDRLYEQFQNNRSVYYVAFDNDKMIGGAGIINTKELPQDVCELVKVYLLPEARGIGLGKKLLHKCLEAAQELSYKKIYLETTSNMKMAIPLYEKFGFRHLESRLGTSKHFGCGVWMLKDL